MKRRWVRYSLRSLFVAVTVAALVCAWVFEQARQREQMLKSVRARPSLPGIALRFIRPEKRVPWSAPAAWFWPVREIPLDPRTVFKEEADQIERLFPEAHVYFQTFL